MAIAESQPQTINALLTANRLIVPEYQRSYSWSNEEDNESGQLKDLWEDIIDSFNNNTDHYLGTISLNKRENIGLIQSYNIIDGQQRLTSLFILLNTIIEKLPDDFQDENGQGKNEYMNQLIGNRTNLNIVLQDEDHSVFSDILFNFVEINEYSLSKRSHIRLYKAKSYFTAILTNSNYNNNEFKINLLNQIQQRTKVLIYNINDGIEAIKIFTVVNDRGLPLSLLDKIKGFFMYNWSKYLENESINNINECFKYVFTHCDEIFLNNIKLKFFSRLTDESQLLLFHYHSSKNTEQISAFYSVKDSADAAFTKIKFICNSLKNNRDELRNFMLNYSEDLSTFFNKFSEIFNFELFRNLQNYLPFWEMNFNLMPLLIRLHQRSMIDNLIDDIEKTDLWIYKLGKSSMKADLYTLAADVSTNNVNESQIKSELKKIRNSISSDIILDNLKGNMYYNDSIKYLLYIVENKIRREEKLPVMTLEEFRNLYVEHIFSRNPAHEKQENGFLDESDYSNNINKIGNLTLFEVDNSNDHPSIKANHYLSSNSILTRKIGSEIIRDEFNKDKMLERGEDLINIIYEYINV